MGARENRSGVAVSRVVKRVATRVSVLAVLALQGCGCNLVGCEDGLNVHLASLPAGAFQVELLVDGVAMPGPSAAVCAGTATCYQDIWFYQQKPQSGSVRVTTASGTRLTHFSNIKYEEGFPNGRRCGAACSNARVTAQLP